MPTAVSRQVRASRGKSNLLSKQSSTNITNFARVSKLQTFGKEAAKQASLLGAGGFTSSIEVVLSSRKRKADSDLDSPQTTQRIDLPPSSTRSSKRPCREVSDIQSIPSLFVASKKRKAISSDDDKENVSEVISADLSLLDSLSTKQLHQKRPRGSDSGASAAAQAEALLERLNLQSSPRKRSRVLDSKIRERLPDEILHLISLQASFLKALSLHHAHNGAHVPVDLRAICPNVAQSWGRRKVVLEDISRCVGVVAWERPDKSDTTSFRNPLLLSDYGQGKICIELDPGAEAGPLKEEKINARFEENLRLLWSARKESDVKSFIANLPKAIPRASATKKLPLLSKGQKTLDEFKKDIVKKQQEKEEAKARTEPALNSDGSKMSLIDRIRFKELQLSQAAQPPSAAELQRRAALQRADDVAGVIGMLSMATAGGRARISFTMAAVLIKLKDSLRIPISHEEGACCVRLLATEVAPQWLRVVTIGGKENVVIQMASQPSKAAIQDRVNVLST
ncbi:hypothetical protein QBC33DRAFT_526816 [Phialemonium atrogriseum]|uniref:DNA replication factor Cdt1 C-terminal domain-containing protein n=1 Tax=Phialemonium atrogriseum TaxID=1093897 RepID=A0AAJ0C6K2_9PEZI|nr:uncharacterized protein QBC33DRAFT_526816 [Phialemonium atrogriseum]KAK1771095.1 hypothetical protein QBC33DRAFT_526816 [Phialemonium atrogriseum]